MPPYRILLDECVDRRLAKDLRGQFVKTVAQMGWAGLTNGDLLRKAQPEFDVFITTDRGLPHQQNLPSANITVIVLRARSSRLSDLRKLVPDILAALPNLRPGAPIFLGG